MGARVRRPVVWLEMMGGGGWPASPESSVAAAQLQPSCDRDEYEGDSHQVIKPNSATTQEKLTVQLM